MKIASWKTFLWMCFLALLGPTDAMGESSADALGGVQSSEVEKIAADLANPLSSVTTIAGQLRLEFGNGPDDEINEQVRLQPSFFKPFSDQSAFLMRTIVPLQFKDWPTDQAGLGDISLVPYYVPDTTRDLFAGFGAALGIPSATDDTLGSEKWTAGPAAIVAKTGQPITFGGLIQHVWSYAGDGDRGDVSATTVQPFLTYLIGNGWASSLNMEASYNWEADQDPWVIPLSMGVSRAVNLRGKFLNVGLATIGYLDKPDYAADWELRLNVTYVFR